MLEDYFRQYSLLMVFTGVAVIVPSSVLVLSWLLSLVRVRPTKANPVKYETYECGMETIGGRWTRFNFRYYMYALLFIIFDVEVVFIYPWAVRFNKLGLFALVEMIVFLVILLAAWGYAWRKGDLEWR